MFTELFPILATPDLKRSLAFYRDLVGAKVAYEFSGPDGEPAYVGLDLGKSHLGIGLDATAASGPTPASACGSTPTIAMRRSMRYARPG